MKVLRYCVVCCIVCLVLGIPFAQAEEIAKVDNFVIQDTDFIKRAELLPERGPGGHANIDRERLLNKMIDEELLLREAQKLNLHDNEDYKFKVETYKRELLVDLYLRQYLKKKSTEENQKKFYEENKTRYTSPEAVRISDIRVKSEEEAKDVLGKARAGEDFAELARKYSKGPGADEGGDLGFRNKRSLRRDFEVAFSMKVGDISEPIKAQDGYHIIKVTDRREEGIQKFEDVKVRVANEYARKLLEDRISELRKAAKIHIDAAGLKNLKIE